MKGKVPGVVSVKSRPGDVGRGVERLHVDAFGGVPDEVVGGCAFAFLGGELGPVLQVGVLGVGHRGTVRHSCGPVPTGARNRSSRGLACRGPCRHHPLGPQGEHVVAVQVACASVARCSLPPAARSRARRGSPRPAARRPRPRSTVPPRPPHRRRVAPSRAHRRWYPHRRSKTPATPMVEAAHRRAGGRRWKCTARGQGVPTRRAGVRAWPARAPETPTPCAFPTP